MSEEELDGIGRVVAIIAHDLNNTLAVIRGFGEIVREELGPGNPLDEDMAQILSAVSQGSSLATALLAIGGRSSFEAETFDIDEHLAGLGDALRGVETSFAAGVRVTFDPALLASIVTSLLDNAREATAGSGGTVRLETAVRDARVAITVRDTGIGMDGPTLARAFEPFFTTHGRARKGLGLAVARGILRQGGATIAIESQPGLGTAVHIGLPVA